MNSLVAGLIAGLLATIPMTHVMVGLFRLLPRHEQYPLPPREITENLTDKAGVGVGSGTRSVSWMVEIVEV